MLLAHLRWELREFFFLEEAERRSTKLSALQRESVRAYYAAAKRRLFATQALGDTTDAPAGLLLYREAWLCLTRAILLADDEGADVARLAPEAAWQKLDRALEERHLVAPPDAADAKEAILAPDPLAFDRLSSEDAARSVEALDATTRWLAGLIETRSPLELERTRTIRQIATAVCLLALAIALFVRLRMPKDLALNMPVESTPTAFETTAAGAVDGEKNGRFGFHTQDAESPFLTINLVKPAVLSTIKVFGRGECCFDQSVPLALEVSEDGVTFRKLAERTEAFSESEPWVISPPRADAVRFVRLRGEHRGILVLSEVEVYGKPKKN